jgi:hypothetical protein
MLLRTGLLVGILLSAASVAAQQTRETDPITGDWGTDGRRLLQLKFDGKQTVTGTVFLFREYKQISSAVIERGSFDRRTGVLKLTGDIVVDGKSLPYVVEGTIENETFNAAYKFGSEGGRATLNKQ